MNSLFELLVYDQIFRRKTVRVQSNKLLPSLKNHQGTIFFASSAGAIYAGVTDEVITEKTPPQPLTAYGEAKLQQEAMLTAWVQERQNVSLLIARISTLYGPAQAKGKAQGLLSHLARSIVTRTPVNIFVPLDTIRDYIHVDDAAEKILRVLHSVRRTSSVVTTIVASEESVSIATIVGIVRSLTRLPPRIITSARSYTAHYPRRLRFRSLVRADAWKPHCTLALGITALLRSERARSTKAN